jgi:hypothetical protein
MSAILRQHRYPSAEGAGAFRPLRPQLSHGGRQARSKVIPRIRFPARSGFPKIDCSFPQLENARGRSLWRLNLDELVVQAVVASSGSPSGEPSACAAVLSSGCADFKPPACAGCPTFRLDRGPTPPSRIGVLPRGSIGGKHPARTVCYALPIVRRLTFQLALASLLRLGLRPLPTHIGRVSSARLVSNPPAFAGGCCNLQLALSAAAAVSLRCLPPVCHTGRELPTRIGCSSTGFTGFKSLGSRLAPLPPAGPPKHP